MKTDLAREKFADAIMVLAGNLALAAVVSPFVYLIEMRALQPTEQWLLRAAPILIALLAGVLYVLALRLFDEIGKRR